MSNFAGQVLLVEDEPIVGETLCFNLEAEGFSVRWIQHGGKALEWICENFDEPGVIVLDLMLPGVDGFTILQKVRHLAEKTPIIVLSAKNAEESRVRAFELGADDYVTKPFSLAELILRVKGLEKRRQWYADSILPDEVLVLGNCRFYPGRLVLERDGGESIRLSPMLGMLVRTFLANPNRILSRPELLRKVWQHEGVQQTRTVDVFVSKLRRYVEQDPTNPEFLVSVRSAGYAYVTDPEVRLELAKGSI